MNPTTHSSAIMKGGCYKVSWETYYPHTLEHHHKIILADSLICPHHFSLQSGFLISILLVVESAVRKENHNITYLVLNDHLKGQPHILCLSHRHSNVHWLSQMNWTVFISYFWTILIEIFPNSYSLQHFWLYKVVF